MSSCPALRRASTSLAAREDVDGRDKPGHDDEVDAFHLIASLAAGRIRWANPPYPSLFDPYARLVTVDELDAGFFQSTLNRLKRARLEQFPGFEARNRARRDLGELCDVANPKLQCGSGHSGLRGRHRNHAPI